MEQLLAEQKRELLRHGIPESDDEDWGGHHWPEEEESDFVKGEEDSWDNEELTYITSILASFSRPKSYLGQTNKLDCANFTPEGVPTRAPAQQTTPPKFNEKFNQNSTIKTSEAENFSCFPTLWEEGHTELADYFTDEEDDSLDNEDTISKSDTWSQPDFEELGEISDEEDTENEIEAAKFEFETINDVNYEEPSERAILKGISSISTETALAFSTWQPYIPPEPVFRSSSAQSWWSASSQQASLSQEPTLTQISTITSPDLTIEQTPAQMRMLPSKCKMRRSQQQDWKQSRPAMKRYTHIWSKPWPKLSKTYKRTKNSRNKFQDHLEP
jgi:hypothetical protein